MTRWLNFTLNWIYYVSMTFACILLAFGFVAFITLIVCGVYWGLNFLGLPKEFSGVLTSFFVAAAVIGTVLSASDDLSSGDY